MARAPQSPPPSGEFLTHGKLPHDGARGYPGQITWGRAAERHMVTCIATGRRIGKSTFVQYYILDRGGDECFKGRIYEAAYGAQGHPQAKEMFENCLADWKAAGIVARHHASEGQDRYMILHPYGHNAGAKIWFISLDATAYPGFYGKGLDLAMPDEMGQIPPAAITQCLRPMLMDKNGKLVCLGTPYPEGVGFAYFESLFNMGVKGHPTYDPDYCSFNAPSECNPFVSYERIQKERLAARLVDPIIERCHYDGLFAKDAGAVFKNLDKVFVLKGEEIEPGLWLNRWPKPGERVVLGVDLGKHDDSSVATPFSIDTSEQLAVLRMQGDYIPQLARIDALVQRLNDPIIYADARGNETTLELMRRRYGERAIPVKWTSGGQWDKESQIVRAQTMCQAAAWAMIDVLWQRDEFRLFMKQPFQDSKGMRTSSGWKYGAPSGKHDDAVTAACYALYQLPFVAEVVPPKKVLQPNLTWDALLDSQAIERVSRGFSLRRRGL